MNDKPRKFMIDKSDLNAQDAYELVSKATSDSGVRQHGITLFGSPNNMSLLYQAAQHFHLKIVGIEVNGEIKPVTRKIRKIKAKEWKAFVKGQETNVIRDLITAGANYREKVKMPQIKAKTKASSSATQKLDQLIGLNEVKKQIQDIGHLMKNRKDRKRAGLPAIAMSQHLVFTGNPGTGKTTVARLVGDIYRELGLLKKGQFIEIDGRGLISKYVGKTASKTTEIVNKALDGVLFIDEAYALVQGADFDYGPEAVATLIKMMEDHRDRLVVIIAGYEDEMEKLLESNPGLKSRFKTRIDFPDYDQVELRQIFIQMCRDSSFVLTTEAQQKLGVLFAGMHKNKGEQFGNGRSVRNVFDRCVLNHARRLASNGKPSRKELQTLMQADIADLKDVEW